MLATATQTKQQTNATLTFQEQQNIIELYYKYLDMSAVEIRNKLRQLIKESKLTQQKIANKSGLSIFTINGITRTDKLECKPDIFTIFFICEALGILITDILE
jgi:DNA-binding XRE family transcriptional regulator